MAAPTVVQHEAGSAGPIFTLLSDVHRMAGYPMGRAMSASGSAKVAARRLAA
jgi:hypothetical protein